MNAHNATLAPRRELVLRKLDEATGEPCHPQLFMAADRAPTEELDRAVTFKSKLGVATFLRPMFGEEQARWGWEPVFKDEVVVAPKPVPFDAPFNLLVPDPLEAVRQVYELHHRYCDRVEAWLRGVGTDPGERPDCKITITGPSWAGLYTSNDHSCHYPVAYAMMHLGDTGAPRTPKEDYRLTVAHEVVHGYQTAFAGVGRPVVGHGGDFYALMRLAAREPVGTHYHAHDVVEVARLAESLGRYWAVAKEAGLVATLPCKVETRGRKRTNAIK